MFDGSKIGNLKKFLVILKVNNFRETKIKIEYEK